MKYYSVIPATAFPELQKKFDIITQLTDDNGLTGEVLLEGEHSSDLLEEIERVGGVNYDFEGFLSRNG